MINYTVRLVLRIFAIVFPTQKPTLFSGSGSIIKLSQLLTASGYQRPLVVTEKFALELGLLDTLFDSLRAKGCELSVFDGVVPNPTFDVIREGLSVCERDRADCVVVVGGGSAIDTGKVIAAGATNGPKVERLAGVRKIKRAPLPMYVVPTTSGTGSEVTNAAVISDSETHQKKFFVDPRLVPLAAALDPDMLKSLPAHITAATGMDALTHAVESYVSLNPFDDARRDARTAIGLIFKYLPIAYKDGDNLEAREMLAIASFLAGYAFSRSGLGYVHAISHQLSAHYNTPHGLANAILLPRIMRFNRRACQQRFAELETMLAGNLQSVYSEEDLALRLITRVDVLSDDLDIPRALDALQQEDFDVITRQALREAKTSYAVPKSMSSRQCRTVLASVVEGNREVMVA